MSVLKSDYNKLITRFNKALAFLGDDTKTVDEREKWLPDYNILLDKLNSLQVALRLDSVEMTEDEILNGFEEGKHETT